MPKSRNLIDLILVNKPLDWTDILKAELCHFSRKDFITFAVNIYIKAFPQEFKRIEKYNHQIRQTRSSKFGWWYNRGYEEGKDFRWGTSMPRRLQSVLDNLLQPRLFHDQTEMRWFMRQFKVFCIPTVI